MDLATTSPLVGRELDLAVALEQLKRIERGAPASLLVRGPAGIGKSRLVAEAVARAAQVGHTVLTGRADDLDHGIPYAVFRDVLVRLLGDEPGDDVRGAVLALRDAVERGDAGPAGDDLSAVFAGAVRLFRGLAEAAPTVLVLEDLHVADRESLALAALLARLADVPMLTVVAVRPGADASRELEELLERMTFDGRGATVDLDPLDRHETQALVAATVGATPDDEVGAAVFVASHGNPFFAREVVQSFVDGGALVVEGDRVRLVADAPAVALRPSTALLRRVFAGTPGDVELAKVMAVAGRFRLRHLPLVARLTGQAEAELTRSFDRLVRAGLLAASADGYGFTHPIVRDTLYEDIGPAERRRIHAAIAAELATERRAGIVLDVLELATHVAASAEPGDEAAAEVLLEAGRAVAATAPLVSADHVGRAVALLPVGSPLRAPALAMQARALHLGSRPVEAAAAGREALDVLPPGPHRHATAGFVANGLYVAGRAGDALAVVDAELAAGGPPCPLLALRVNLLFETWRRAEAAAELDAAAASLEGSPPPAELMALAHLVQAANHLGEVDVAAALLDRLDLLLAGSVSNTVTLAVHELVAFVDWRPGLVDRLDRHLAAAQALKPDPAAHSIGGTFELAQTRRWVMGGRWDDALELIRSASFDLDQRGIVVGSQLMLMSGCEVLVDRGALDEAAAVAARFVTPIVALDRYAALAGARLRHAVGDTAEAAVILEAAWANGDTEWGTPQLLRELVDIRLEEGRVDEARELAGELEAVAARLGWLECQVPALRARALVDRDVDAARACLALAEAERWDTEQAHAALVLGELDDDPGHHLAQAYKQFDSFNAPPLRRRAAAGLRARGLTVPRRVATPAQSLSDTDVQLVRLVREGLSNRQIATALHYSPKTIEVYLSRIYAKTGFASRLSELIRAVDTGALDVGEGSV